MRSAIASPVLTSSWRRGSVTPGTDGVAGGFYDELAHRLPQRCHGPHIPRISHPDRTVRVGRREQVALARKREREEAVRVPVRDREGAGPHFPNEDGALQ